MTLALAAVIVVVAALGAALLVMLIRHRVGGAVLRDTGRGTSAVALAGTAFAVLLALITLAAFQSYNSAKDGAEAESVAMVDLFRTAALFPDAQRDELRGDFECYARAVVSHEWPAMKDQDTSPVVDHWIYAYRRLFNHVQIQSAREQAGFGEILQAARDRTDGRRERLQESTPSVPTPMWLVLILGGLVSVGLLLAFVDPRESRAVQATMVAGAAALVAAGLLLVSFLDHPYHSGPGGIQPTAMENSVSQMQSQAPNLSLPCHHDGSPRLAS